MTPNEGPHVGHGRAGGAGARQRQTHPASVSVREDREAAGEAGEEAGKRVARLPEAGTEAEHVALLLHLCVTNVTCVKSKVQIASVIEGRAGVCRLGPWGRALTPDLACKLRKLARQPEPGGAGQTGPDCGPDLQTAADSRHSEASVYLLQITNTVMWRQDQSLGFSCSVLEISLCISHR